MQPERNMHGIKGIIGYFKDLIFSVFVRWDFQENGVMSFVMNIDLKNNV